MRNLFSIIIIFALISLSYPIFGQQNYSEIINKGDEVLEKEQYKLALCYYHLAKKIDSTKNKLTTSSIDNLFNKMAQNQSLKSLDWGSSDGQYTEVEAPTDDPYDNAYDDYLVVDPKALQREKEFMEIKTLPESFSNLLKLEKIILNNNKLKKLPVLIGNLKKTIYLDLSDNKLIDFPNSFSNLKALKHLNLASNEFANLPIFFSQLTKLEELNLRTNKFKIFPNEVLSLKNLKKLTLSSNFIAQIPEDIGKLKSLEYLSMYRMELRKLPASLANLKKINYLNLNSNRISIVPSFIKNLKELKYLGLEYNKIKELPEFIGDLTKLEQINLAGNRIPIEDILFIKDKLPNCKINFLYAREARTLYKETKFKEAFLFQKLAVEKTPKEYTNWFSLSWYAIINNDPELAIKAANKTLLLNPKALSVETNLSLGYLLNNEWAKAEAIYLKWKGNQFLGDKRLCDDIFLQDLVDLKERGITHPDFERVEAIFQKKENEQVDISIEDDPKNYEEAILHGDIAFKQALLVLAIKKYSQGAQFRPESKEVIQNKIQKVFKNLGELNNQQELMLLKFQLTELPSEIGELTNLSLLGLTRNNLKRLPKEIGNLIYLKKFAADRNQIQKLPEEFGLLKQLVFINLISNDLEELPTSIGALKSLRELHISKNKLKKLPETIDGLTRLKTFDLNNNKITVLPKSIGKLRALQKLTLRNNELKEIPEELLQLSELKELNLSNNQLTSLPKEINKLKKLKILRISGNLLSQNEIDRIKSKLPLCKIYK